MPRECGGGDASGGPSCWASRKGSHGSAKLRCEKGKGKPRGTLKATVVWHELTHNDVDGFEDAHLIVQDPPPPPPLHPPAAPIAIMQARATQSIGSGKSRAGRHAGVAAVAPRWQRDKEGRNSAVGKNQDTRASLSPSSSCGRWVRPASARSLAGRKKIRRCHWPAVCPGGHGGLRYRPHFRIYFLGPTRTYRTNLF